MVFEVTPTRIFVRYIATVLLLGLLTIVVNAYTIVLRDGRRLEIPNNFTVSKMTLTYEISPGFQKTVLLDSIDIAATERANNEPLGSFLKQGRNKTVTVPAPIQKQSQRSITNRDLETFRQTRVENEAAYERRRRELGLPSLEEIRRAAEVEGDRGRERLIAMRSQEADAESYWRSRASALRSEIAAINARIDFVRARLNETPDGSAFGVFTTALPFGLVGQSRFRSTGQKPFQQPLVFSARQGTPQIRGGVRFGGGHTRGRVLINPVHRLQRSRGFPVFAPVQLLSIPFQNYDYSYERSELIVQLDELLSHRAGLQARWRDLEEEARRAGAYPGWLRP